MSREITSEEGAYKYVRLLERQREASKRYYEKHYKLVPEKTPEEIATALEKIEKRNKRQLGYYYKNQEARQEKAREYQARRRLEAQSQTPPATD